MSYRFSYSGGIYGKPLTLTLFDPEENSKEVTGPEAGRLHKSLMDTPKGGAREERVKEIWNALPS